MGLEGKENPARGVEISGAKSEKKFGWTDEQMEQIRQAADEVDRTGQFAISARYLVELGWGEGYGKESFSRPMETTSISLGIRTKLRTKC